MSSVNYIDGFKSEKYFCDYQNSPLSSAVLYYLNPKLEEHSHVVNGIKQDKTYNGHDDTAYITIEVESVEELESAMIGLKLFEDFGEKYWLPSPSAEFEINNITKIVTNLYQIEFGLPASFQL